MDSPSAQRPAETTGPHILVIEHEADDPVSLVGEWLRAAGARLDERLAWAGDPLPGDLSGHDALLVMGGAMGAHDDAEHAWLTAVKALFREAAADSVPALGICLGHQLAAVALGGRVTVNPLGKQVGLLPVGWRAGAAEDELFGAVAGPRRALQWNDDIVATLPDGATELATATTGEVQAARFAPTVWGIQWHPEVDDVLVRRWIAEEGLPDGSDPETHLSALREARAELDEAWQPLAERFVHLAGRDAGVR